MDTNAAGEGLTFAPNDEEMSAFDALPRALREKLRNADFKYSSLQIRHALWSGMPADKLLQAIDRNDAQRKATK